MCWIRKAFREAQQLGLSSACDAEKTLERSISDEAFQRVHVAIFTKFRTNPYWAWNDPSRGKILHSDGIHFDISLSLYPRRDSSGSLFHDLYLQTDLEAEKSNRDRNVTPENPYAILRTSARFSIRNISPTNTSLEWTQGRSRDLLLYDLAVAFPTGMLPIGLTSVALLYGLRGSLDREIRARGEGIPQYQDTLAGLAPNVGSLPTDQRVTAQAPQAPRPATSTQQSQTPVVSKGSPETNRFALIELE